MSILFPPKNLSLVYYQVRARAVIKAVAKVYSNKSKLPKEQQGDQVLMII